MDADQWHIPISNNDVILRDALDSMKSFKLEPDEVPLSIRLTENPKYDIGLFPGYISLQNHDAIHAILGRGVLLKDEAFVIGFTMGSTKRLNTLRERLFLLITRYLYPDGYKFYEDEQRIFKIAANCAKSMNCSDISTVDFSRYIDYTLSDIREEMNIDTERLCQIYRVEKLNYDSPESQRLI